MVATRSRVAFIKSAGTFFEWLPESVNGVIAGAFARLMARRDTSSRSNLERNLSYVLGVRSSTLDPLLLERFVVRGFGSYAQYWAEGAKLPALKKRKVYERFCIAEGLEHLLTAKAMGNGVVIALPHVGSWEWGGSFLNSLGLPMTAVAEELDPPELFNWFKAKRESIGIQIEPLNAHAGTVLLSTLRAGNVVGLLCDRDIQGNGIEVEFFNELVAMPAGPATLALRTGAVLVAAACYSGPGRDHFAVVTPPIDTNRTISLRADVARVTQSVARELEGLIRRAPEQWHVLEERFPR